MVLVIRESAIDRLGVFTTQPIKKGEYVCGYGDQLVDAASDYAMKFPDGTLRGGARPTGIDADEAPSMCGFMMNDASVISIVHTETDRATLPRVRAAVDAYISNSMRNRNVAFVGSNGNLHARRDIDADEELLLHYGHVYWLTRLSHNPVYDYYFRFLCRVELVNRDDDGVYRRVLMDALRDPGSASRFVSGFLFLDSRGDDLTYVRRMYAHALAGGA